MLVRGTVDITLLVNFVGHTLGRWAVDALMILLLLIPVFAMFEVVQGSTPGLLGKRLRFNTVVAVRNWSFLALTLGTFSFLGKAYQTMTERDIFTNSTVAISLTGTNWQIAHARGQHSYIHGAWFEATNLNMANLSFSTRELVVLRDLAAQVSYLGLAAVLFVLCAGAYRGKPFNALVVKSLYSYAVIIVVAQTALQYLEGKLSGVLADEVAILGDKNLYVNWPQGGTYNFPGWQFAVAILLLALAQIFKRGESLQRDTEGLV